MKLLGKLKKQVENAGSKGEAKDAIKKAGMLLNDEELEQVAGGAGVREALSSSCPNCGEEENIECLGVDPGRRAVNFRCLNEWCLMEFTKYYD
ncbi:MAG: hypothetical protein K6G83_02215 [Lachnospiraceae bacterium]|nr:hypothetical protein [Lachnospiraceae bacterium]